MSKPPKKRDMLKPNNHRPYIYDGIPNSEVKGVSKVYVGPLCPGRLPWPSDIAAYYRDKL